jgi:hypothetical protein
MIGTIRKYVKRTYKKIVKDSENGDAPSAIWKSLTIDGSLKEKPFGVRL